jgi:hypothetical protein
MQRQVIIEFRSKDRPPWRHLNGDRPRTATYTIPDMKVSVDWQKIKKAAKYYIWGKFRATANLDNGRQMAVYGSTPQIAEDKLKDLMSLSTAKIVTLSITEEKDRNAALKKSPTVMYPAHITVTIRRPTTDPNRRPDIEGNKWNEERKRFEIWQDTEPDDFDEFLRGLTQPQEQ